MKNEIRKIYENYGELLLHYLLFLLSNRADAEDVLANLFFKIVRHQKRIFRARNLKSYLFAMARNEARDFIKAQIKKQKLEEKMATSLIEPKDKTISFEEKEKVNLALSKLPVEQKEVITLKIWQGFTFKEISQILKVSLDTCASRYRYAIEKLKEELKR